MPDVSGIGKSTFLIYFLWPQKTILVGFQKEIFLQINEAVQHDFFSGFGLAFPYLVDFIETYEPPQGIGTCTIIFSSPCDGKFKQTMRKSESFKYVMPVWFEEELFMLHHVTWKDVKEN